MKNFLCLIAALLLCLTACGSAEEGTKDTTAFVIERAEGPDGSFVEYPQFISNSIGANKANMLLETEAKLGQYRALLNNLSGNGTGLKVTANVTAGKRCASVLLSVDGKMLSGPPSKAYYPFVLDLESGESVSFDALFSDADAAKERINALLDDEILPELSTYLENSELHPVPYDRFCIQDGMLTVYYEKNALSFLSGDPGAVSFRFSELWDVLDRSEGSVFRDLMPANAYEEFWDANVDRQALQTEWSEKGMLCGLEGVSVGDDLQNTLDRYRSTVDSGYYPGGACYEVEAPQLRGVWLLTDESEETVTGILASRLDSMGIETGKISLSHAIDLLGEPDAKLSLDADTAEMYLVCPGTAVQYQETIRTGEEESAGCFTLYADEDGTVQYLSLNIE